MTDRRPSLRAHFAWTLGGNVANAASQWAILMLLAKLGSAETLGQYALAVAIATPVAMLAHLNLRAVLATDVAGEHPFGDYFAVRIGATAAGLVAIAALASAARNLTVLAAGAALMLDNIADLYYGAMQRRERLDLIARSMILRSAATIATVGCAVWWWRSALAAAIALAVARCAVFVAYDLPRAAAGPYRRQQPWSILRAAAPLGAVLLLVALTANVPRYAIERYLGVRELGAFAAVASFVTVGWTVVNALGQSAVTRMAAHFNAGEHTAFRRVAARLALLAGAAGLAGAAIAAAAGGPLLALFYRVEFEVYAPLLVVVMLAGASGYVAAALGYAVTSTRRFTAQVPLAAAGAFASFAVSFAMVPAIGLPGAAAAMGAAGLAQIAGQLWLLRRVR